MKKALFILIPLVLVGGFVGLARMGVVKIPGLTPAKKAKPVASKSAAQAAPTPPKAASKVASSAPKQQASPPPAEQIDKAKGASALAELWNEIDSAKLKEILKDWKDQDVALVFAQMDTDKVAEVMAQLDPKRASKLSQIVEKQASIVKQEAGAS